MDVMDVRWTLKERCVLAALDRIWNIEIIPLTRALFHLSHRIYNKLNILISSKNQYYGKVTKYRIQAVVVVELIQLYHCDGV